MSGRDEWVGGGVVRRSSRRVRGADADGGGGVVRRSSNGRGWAAGLVMIAALGWPARAAGYSSPGLYAGSPAAEGGGGGRYFTGSLRDGYACAVCHVGGAAPTVTLEGAPGGAYAPGAVYTFDLRIAAGAIERTALTGEVVDGDGAGMGRLTLSPKDLLTDEERCAGGGHGGSLFEGEDGRHVAALADCLARRLRVQWTAPEAGRGPAFIHFAGVAADGDGTPANDGMMAIALEVPELGTTEAGCRIAGEEGWWGATGLLALAPWWRRRGAVGLLARALWWRRGVAAIATLLLATLASGCSRVKPYERGRLAQPDMKLTADEDLTAGQLHATEYREGSVGGEGGGGGGCGCN